MTNSYDIPTKRQILIYIVHCKSRLGLAPVRCMGFSTLIAGRNRTFFALSQVALLSESGIVNPWIGQGGSPSKRWLTQNVKRSRLSRDERDSRILWPYNRESAISNREWASRILWPFFSTGKLMIRNGKRSLRLQWRLSRTAGGYRRFSQHLRSDLETANCLLDNWRIRWEAWRIWWGMQTMYLFPGNRKLVTSNLQPEPATWNRPQ
jgi:hypothetical protein